MKRNQLQYLSIAGALLGLLAGCTERNVSTGLPDHPAAAFDAAGPLTSVVTDPAGDAAWNLNSGPGSSKKVPDYLDLVRSEITQKGSDFTMTIDVAAPIGLPDVSTGNGLIGWAIGLDTDPTTAPAGYPLSNGTVVPFEFYVNVTYDGTRFQGMVIDRRPLLTGREAIVTPHPFSITDSRITMTVSASAVGAPSAFGWISFAAVRTASHDGADAFNGVDVATAPGVGVATFPQ